MLAFTVLFLVLFLGLQHFFKSKKPVTPPPAQQQAQSQSPAAPAAAAPSMMMQASQSGPQQAPETGSVQATSETSTVVENELYRITFSNRGAQVTSWILKKYKNDDGKPFELVNREAAAKYGYPLSLYSYDANTRAKLAQALYIPSATGTLTAPGTLSFDYEAGGIKVKKTFTFDNSYVLHAEVSESVNGAPIPALLAWPAGLGDQNTLPQYATGTVQTAQDGKTDEVAWKKVVGGATLNGPFQWAGVSDLYFSAIFLPDASTSVNLITLHNTIDIPRNRKHPDPNQIDHASVLGAVIVGTSAEPLKARIFAGPKALGVLGSVPTYGAPSLEKAVSFGWWGWIAKPLFLILHFLYQHVVANWGWAIVLLTVILNIAMLPTRFQMMKSSLKMQRIQPEMDSIKAKYAKFKATDPRRQEMNKEVFALQKREGVNMFGSCLPMLLQYPLLIGFYRMLGNVIELRQAHWLWLPDLSAPDPWHILPIFVILSMFLTQFYTPSPGMDPTQQRMMAFTMPAVFGFMMWNFGSGLSLYWACSNFIGVVQQLVMNRSSMGREMRAIANKRAAKKNGGKIINARK
jgi:YidC/Oxa1 family membrane protein insertase